MYSAIVSSSFNTQPPEGGWFNGSDGCLFFDLVSTHSRPKAAGPDIGELADLLDCFNTQPPEGGWPKQGQVIPLSIVSTHSRPKAAGSKKMSRLDKVKVSTHSRPKAAGHFFHGLTFHGLFQHTAARRRLGVQASKATFQR